MTFRVDPETHLAVEMRTTEKYFSDDPTVERTDAIDYPEGGPADVYALGVPRDTKVIDRRRARTKDGKEIKDFLEAYVRARGKPLEPFTATVLGSAPGKDFSDVMWAFRGKSAGEKVQVEEVDFEQLTGFASCGPGSSLFRRTGTRRPGGGGKSRG